MSNGPVYKAVVPGAWGVSVCLWKSDKGYNATIQKRYKDKETGEYKEPKSLFLTDLLAVRSAIDCALGWAVANPPNKDSSATDSGSDTKVDTDDVNF
jgi:hypothetical protein